MVSTYSPVPNWRGIKFHLWTIFPTISLYHFPLLQEFDLKKPYSPFKDLDKFLQPIPTLSLPLQLDTAE